MARFFEGYLLPSYTGGVVTAFARRRRRRCGGSSRRSGSTSTRTRPTTTSCRSRCSPATCWIAWDHVARLQDAFRKQPDEFVAFPAPAGPKGRGFMPVVVGLAMPKTAPDAAAAKQVIDYLLQPATQITTLRVSSFFPVVKAAIPADLDPGLKAGGGGGAGAAGRAGRACRRCCRSASARMAASSTRIFTDTFQRIVLRGQDPQAVLDRWRPSRCSACSTRRRRRAGRPIRRARAPAR